MSDGPVGRFALCGILDVDPRFRVELILWVLSATRHLPADRFSIVVFHAGDVPVDLADWLASQGVETRPFTPPVEGAPHCNKIAPFLDPPAADHVLVADTDLFFVGDPSPYFRSHRFRAPPNNHCNPPPRIFKALLSASGIGSAYRPGVALFAGPDGRRETHVNNISAGLVAAPTPRALALGSAWKAWAEWLVRNKALLDAWVVHLDQAAFALAMESLGEDVEHLPPHVNAVMHILPLLETVFAIHLTSAHVPEFVSRFNADRTLVATGWSWGVALAVERLNAAILDAGEIIRRLPSTRDHYDKFLNPAWRRS